MGTSIEYKGFVLTTASRYRRRPEGWTLEVRIKPIGRLGGERRCRAPNLYPTEDRATKSCLTLGRRIIDGTAPPRRK